MGPKVSGAGRRGAELRRAELIRGAERLWGNIPGAECRGAVGQWGRTSWGRTSLGQNLWGRWSWAEGSGAGSRSPYFQNRCIRNIYLTPDISKFKGLRVLKP